MFTKQEKREMLKNRITKLEKNRGYLSYGEVMTLKRLKKELEEL